MTGVDTDDTSTQITAMSEDSGPPPEPDAPKFATAEFRYGIFVSLIVGCLVYGGTLLLPRLFKSAPPTTDAPAPAMGDVSPAGPASPQPRCRYGLGACDWAGLHLPRPPCHGGVGACDWAGLQSPQPPQPHCHYGVGRCDWAKKSPN
jgi:hypothetical protein